LTGRFATELDELPASERDDVGAMLSASPDSRPSAHEALARLRTPVDDLTVLAGGGPSAEDSLRGPARIDPRLGRSIDVIAADSWSDSELDMLCTARNPWLQNILDREGRAFRLAAWPDGCRTLDSGAPWRTILDPLALELLDPAGEPNAPAAADSRQALHDAITARLDGAAIVVTPAGERMLALDRLLLR
jgi:hypothetical protein